MGRYASKCPNCNALNARTAECQMCGADLRELDKKKASALAAAGKAVVDVPLKFHYTPNTKIPVPPASQAAALASASPPPQMALQAPPITPPLRSVFEHPALEKHDFTVEYCDNCHSPIKQGDVDCSLCGMPVKPGHEPEVAKRLPGDYSDLRSAVAAKPDRRQSPAKVERTSSGPITVSSPVDEIVTRFLPYLTNPKVWVPVVVVVLGFVVVGHFYKSPEERAVLAAARFIPVYDSKVRPSSSTVQMEDGGQAIVTYYSSSGTELEALEAYQSADGKWHCTSEPN